MCTKIAFMSALSLAVVICPAASADKERLSRAQVKADTLEAAKAGNLISAAQGVVAAHRGVVSSKTSAQRIAETLQARAAGELAPAGPAAEMRIWQTESRRPSVISRADGEAETLAAAAAGLLIPTGEGPDAARR